MDEFEFLDKATSSRGKLTEKAVEGVVAWLVKRVLRRRREVEAVADVGDGEGVKK